MKFNRTRRWLAALALIGSLGLASNTHAALSDNCTYPTSADTFVERDTGYKVTALDYNKIQCAIDKLQTALGLSSGYNFILDSAGVITATELAAGSVGLSELTNACENGIVEWTSFTPACIATPTGGGGGGSSIVLDIGDDASNESAGVTEIATTGDTNSVFIEDAGTPDKLLIRVGQNWPTADAADALSANGGNCSAGSAPLGVDQQGAVEGCFAVLTDTANSVDKTNLASASVGLSELTNACSDGVITYIGGTPWCGATYLPDTIDSVDATNLAPDSVAASEIAANAVGNSEMADNSVGNAEMRDDAIGLAELNACTSGTNQVTVYNSGVPACEERTEGVAIKDAGVPLGSGYTTLHFGYTIAPTIVSGTEILLDVGPNTIGASEIAPNGVGASEIAADAVGDSEIAANAVGNSEMADDAIGLAELNACPTGTNQIPVYNSGVPACEERTGGFTIKSEGVPVGSNYTTLDFEATIAPTIVSGTEILLGLGDVYVPGVTQILDGDTSSVTFRKDQNNTMSASTSVTWNSTTFAGAILGTIDAGGASLELPNGTTDNSTTTGYITVDTNGPTGRSGILHATVGTGSKAFPMRSCWQTYIYNPGLAGNLACTPGRCTIPFTGIQVRQRNGFDVNVSRLVCTAYEDLSNGVSLAIALNTVTESACTSSSDGAVNASCSLAATSAACTITGTTGTTEDNCSWQGNVSITEEQAWTLNFVWTGTEETNLYGCSMTFCAAEPW